MSFSKKWFQWKSEHSTAGSSQRENESKAAAPFDLKVKRKILCRWGSFVARQETKKKLNGGFSFLHYLNNQELIHSLDYISLTDFFCSLSLLCISISYGTIFPSSPTATDVLEKVDCCSASSTLGGKFLWMFD